MHPVHHRHRDTHQHRIEEVQEHFVTDNVPIEPLRILGEAHDRAHEDAQRHQVQRPHVLAPRRAAGLFGRPAVEARVEAYADDHEQAEEGQLQEEAGEDGFVARVQHA